ncbi:hypothetical protein QYE76_064822 [Lolium multiflorum]|uniref:Retrotransposon gag domain-containing protein n=1 Tax=Lolium multiflorum TaxID=4521 RepID=A0AAD8S7Q1_LOLMU|nr:hypothetical protein QYE76_064822 [Lolium multiflorum]
MKKAAELLAKKDEEIDINHVRTLVASAMKQQSKADTSRRLESNPEHCVSTAQKDASGTQHRDDESRTGSTERRRKTKEHPNPIPVPSETPPTDPVKGKGPMMIREEPKPRRLNLKLPENLKHYDGNERSDTWIDDYYHAVTFAGGTPNIACRMLQLYLVGPARIWLNDLEKNSIFCWFDLQNAFEKHFRGTYKRPSTTSDLQACIQKKGETSRNFLTRWLATRNECENVDNRTAMHAFIGGLQRGGLLRHKLTCLVNENKLTLDDMINITSNHTAADDDRKNPSEDQKGGISNMVAMTFQRGGQGGERGRGSGGGAGRGQQRADEVTVAGTRTPQTYEEYRDMPCLAHIDLATSKSSHTNRNCKWVDDLKTGPEAGYKRARKHRL